VDSQPAALARLPLVKQVSSRWPVVRAGASCCLADQVNREGGMVWCSEVQKTEPAELTSSTGVRAIAFMAEIAPNADDVEIADTSSLWPEQSRSPPGRLIATNSLRTA